MQNLPCLPSVTVVVGGAVVVVVVWSTDLKYVCCLLAWHHRCTMNVAMSKLSKTFVFSPVLQHAHQVLTVRSNQPGTFICCQMPPPPQELFILLTIIALREGLGLSEPDACRPWLLTGRVCCVECTPQRAVGVGWLLCGALIPD